MIFLFFLGLRWDMLVFRRVASASMKKICFSSTVSAWGYSLSRLGKLSRKRSKIDALLGGGFKYFLFSPLFWGRFPIWLIFFRWVATTNQFFLCCFVLSPSRILKLSGSSSFKSPKKRFQPTKITAQAVDIFSIGIVIFKEVKSGYYLLLITYYYIWFPSPPCKFYINSPQALTKRLGLPSTYPKFSSWHVPPTRTGHIQGPEVKND